ncbi:hypothetical protein KXD40_003566 [Peronospora effusa]|nr:hypothetical protein KXD40_003566 [Peronospora effusa]
MAPNAWHQCPMLQVSVAFALPGSELSHHLSRAGVPTSLPRCVALRRVPWSVWQGSCLSRVLVQHYICNLHNNFQDPGWEAQHQDRSGGVASRRPRPVEVKELGTARGGTYWCPAETGAAGMMLCVWASSAVTVTLDASAVIASTAALRGPVGVGATSLRDSGKRGEQRLESRAAAAAK